MAKNYALIRQGRELKSQRDTLIQSLTNARQNGNTTFIKHYEKKLEQVERSLADNMSKQKAR